MTGVYTPGPATGLWERMGLNRRERAQVKRAALGCLFVLILAAGAAGMWVAGFQAMDAEATRQQQVMEARR
tara:strand:+ start:14632 stop:14844 length:213 start_codon:yes stop_codon:yes gene_type:complete